MRKMKNVLIAVVCSLVFCSTVKAQMPASHPDVNWELNENFSDEFNEETIDQVKWDNNTNDWGTWSWEPENAYITDSVLTLQMVQDQHVRGSNDYYFTSGINRSRGKMIYGYYETRIKASAKGQGTCPAFWMYSRGEPNPTEEGGVKYCEIDAIEIFQKPNDEQRLEMNLHTRILEDGELVWKRPGQGHTELTANTWLAPWDPRDDYHTYASWNRLDSIFWYVDGIQRGAKKNYYWHKPMHVTVSMGLRTPYERYINGVRTVMPFPESEPEPGFPTEMYCDYVRVFNTPAQIYADREVYYDQSFSTGQDLLFKVLYFAGNGESVTDEGSEGMTAYLQEVTEDGEIINEIKKVDAAAVGTESGEVRFTFDLDQLPPSSDLPDGNRYVLKPFFRTTKDGGKDIYLAEIEYPITLLASTSVNDPEVLEQVQVKSLLSAIGIEIQDYAGMAEVTVVDMSGRTIYNRQHAESTIYINATDIAATGVVVVTVKLEDKIRMAKILLANN